MTFHFFQNDNVQVSRDDHIAKTLDAFPDVVLDAAPYPVANYLFQIRGKDDKDRKPLPEQQGSLFNKVVTQLLFADFGVRRYIQTAVVFLATPVKDPTEVDWGKLKRVIKYLHGKKTVKVNSTC